VRTTVDIPDPIYRRLKSRAALRGCSVKELILHGVEAELNGEPGRASKTRITLPLIKSKRPGWLRLSNKAINEIILP
jgi:hypothetical protein